MHIHSDGGEDPRALISRMEQTGVWGGAVFSRSPKQSGFDPAAPSGSSRLGQILKLTADYPGRLLPVLWIHPDEDGAENLVEEAAGRGIKGFKIICNSFHVYEDKPMKLLERVAKTGLPVCFHSGILWDLSVSSQYNRPLDWEYLVNIRGIRFSLAHCSWPWYDECIALYSKFLSLATSPDFTAEMFFDLTPGTPPTYRKDLFTKLVASGFDTEHNMMFGSDCSAADYRGEWARQWIERDTEILGGLGVGEEAMERSFCNNALRFFGVSGEVYRYKGVTPDRSNE
jgi:predicted TIM-barrel fold metal-dependent hydrolase